MPMTLLIDAGRGNARRRPRYLPGVIAVATSQPTREIRLHLAMGEPRNVVCLVVRGALGLPGGGVAVDLLASLLFSQYLTGPLFNVALFDAPKLAAVSLLPLGVVAVATWRPRSPRAASCYGRAGPPRRPPSSASGRRPGPCAAPRCSWPWAASGDEAAIRGLPTTFRTPEAGRIVQALEKAGVRNPVIILDEIDKVGGRKHNGGIGVADGAGR